MPGDLEYGCPVHMFYTPTLDGLHLPQVNKEIPSKDT